MPDEIQNAVTIVENIILFTLQIDKHFFSNCFSVSQKQHSMYPSRQFKYTEASSVTKNPNFCKTRETFYSSQVPESQETPFGERDWGGRWEAYLWTSMECYTC